MIVRNVTVDITPEAAQRIAELGLEDEVEREAEYTHSTIPTLSEIRIDTWYDYEEDTGVYLSFTAIKEGPYVRRDPEVHSWIRGLLEFTSMTFNQWCATSLYARGALNERSGVH